jgi:uncharacterized cofD-like protein
MNATARQSSNLPKVALIGGGTGSFTLLQSLKKARINLSAIVNMSDDGGSTGKLRDELGVLPPGDVRQCLVALSQLPEVRELFDYRFGKGSLAGQSLGNIILSGLELQKGSFIEAIKVASSLLQIKGNVVPITVEKHTLIMADGPSIVSGESKVLTHTIKSPSPKLWLEPPARINPEAKHVLQTADMIIIAPGNLYASLLPAMVVDGVKQALSRSKAKVVLVTNLINKPTQTKGWHVIDYVHCLEGYIGQGRIDYVIFNNKEPSRQLLQKYAQDGDYPVMFGADKFTGSTVKKIGDDLVAKKIFQQNPNDKAIQRTLIRHDADKLTITIKQILKDK